MTDRRRATLLQFVIVASAAVVPVLLAVLLAVASARDADTSTSARSSDRHVSVRHVAALKTFESAFVRRDRVKAALPTSETLLERFPQCRTEWEARGGPLDGLR